jgi:hypothetical protein
MYTSLVTYFIRTVSRLRSMRVACQAAGGRDQASARPLAAPWFVLGIERRTLDDQIEGPRPLLGSAQCTVE